MIIQTMETILVAYASPHGSTRGVAEAIGDRLAQAGHMVEIWPIAEVTDVARYDMVVVGSPIRYDRWMPAARDFVLKNQTALRDIPVAYFFTCLTLVKRNEKTERQGLGYAAKLREISDQVQPFEIGRFAGAVDYRKIPFLLRLLLRTMMLFTGVKEGDYRDWDAVHAWADTLIHKGVKNEALG